MDKVFSNIAVSILATVVSFLGWDPAILKEAPRSVVETFTETTTSSPAVVAPIKKDVAPPKIVTKVTPAPPRPKVVTPPKAPVVQKPVVAEPIIETPKVEPVAPVVVPPPVVPVVIAPIVPVTPPPSKTSPSLSGLELVKAATVNILCKMPAGNQIAHYSGSGVVIDPSGIILTNAHVAEHILLEQAGRETCFIRTGSPASNSYKAKIVYFPDTWLERNKFNLGQILTGNGEYDYAFLMLSSRVSASAYDVPLPYLAPELNGFSIGTSITMAGYPILSQNVSILNSALYLLTTPSTIKIIGGYDGRSSDVINSGATSIAEHGSSGGAIASNDKLIGIIDSTVIDRESGGKAVQGITLSYINRSLQQIGKSIQSLIDNAQSEASSFATNKVQTLSSML